jgi:hypothetical protein
VLLITKPAFFVKIAFTFTEMLHICEKASAARGELENSRSSVKPWA